MPDLRARTVPESGFVAVEGIDRSGKTTLVAALRTALAGRGWRVAARAEPSTGPVGVFFRQVSADLTLPAYAAALLSAADRHQQQPTLAHDLATHDLVVSDRYYLSGLAYHHADGIEPAAYRSLNGGIRRPDLYLYLAVTPAVAAGRGEPPQGRWEHPDLTARLPAAYTAAIDQLVDVEHARLIHIDASQPAPQVLFEALDAITAVASERKPQP
ncbi:dTMP kinase [Micromonospora sp. Llam7]|uniref:dTMP kinase n=1 Tax=Micromonospora tarapacensis TaxID=2835305 RepID=UPI001C83BF3A|nr:dTMP kinase [Micromonospora tarapacensis]MBX7267522.1 dTMP kinase [Micromonospora tarapacensis]